MSLETALALASAAEEGVAVSQRAGHVLPRDGEQRQLSPRELEVARLVAQGMTSRQIGVALFITEGTAALHVKHILAKLGFISRAQVAAWAVEQGFASSHLR